MIATATLMPGSLQRMVSRIRNDPSHISPKIPTAGLAELSTIIALMDGAAQLRK